MRADVLRHLAESDRPRGGLASEVLVVRREPDVLAVHPLVQLVGAGPDRRTGEGVLAERHVALRADDPEGVARETLLEQHVRLLRDHPHTVATQRLDMTYRGHEPVRGTDQRFVPVTPGCAEREHHVVGGHLGAVVEAHALAQCEIECAIVHPLPARGEARNQRRGLAGTVREEVPADQAVEHRVRHAHGHVAHLLDALEAVGQGVDGDGQCGSRIGLSHRNADRSGQEERGEQNGADERRHATVLPGSTSRRSDDVPPTMNRWMNGRSEFARGM